MEDEEEEDNSKWSIPLSLSLSLYISHLLRPAGSECWWFPGPLNFFGGKGGSEYGWWAVVGSWLEDFIENEVSMLSVISGEETKDGFSIPPTSMPVHHKYTY